VIRKINAIKKEKQSGKNCQSPFPLEKNFERITLISVNRNLNKFYAPFNASTSSRTMLT